MALLNGMSFVPASGPMTHDYTAPVDPRNAIMARLRSMWADPNSAAGTSYESALRGGGDSGSPLAFNLGQGWRQAAQNLTGGHYSGVGGVGRAFRDVQQSQRPDAVKTGQMNFDNHTQGVDQHFTGQSPLDLTTMYDPGPQQQLAAMQQQRGMPSGVQSPGVDNMSVGPGFGGTAGAPPQGGRPNPNPRPPGSSGGPIDGVTMYDPGPMPYGTPLPPKPGVGPYQMAGGGANTKLPLNPAAAPGGPMYASGGSPSAAMGGVPAFGGVGMNPYLGAQIGNLGQQYANMFSRQIAPQINSNAIMAGGYGGGADQRTLALAAGDTMRNFGNAATGLLGQDWSNSQDRALTNQGQMINFASDQRGQDRADLALGASLYGSGTNGMWDPIKAANGVYGSYTGFGNNTTSQGGGWQGALGGALAGGVLAKNMGWG